MAWTACSLAAGGRGAAREHCRQPPSGQSSKRGSSLAEVRSGSPGASTSPVSTVHRVLVRWRLNRLGLLDRVTRAPVRYEKTAPGELLHLDVKKLRRVPPGGGRHLTRSGATTAGPPAAARTSCTWRSTTSAATSTSKLSRTKRRPRLWRSLDALLITSPSSASASKGSSATTARTTAHFSSKSSPASAVSHSSGPARTGLRLTARRSARFRPSFENGPTSVLTETTPLGCELSRLHQRVQYPAATHGAGRPPAGLATRCVNS